MRKLTATIVGLAILSMGACMKDPRIGPDHNNLTWKNSLVAVPAEFNGKTTYQIRKNLGYTVNFPIINDMVKPGAKIPVVIYAHPCSGITLASNTFINSAMKAGYAVIAPNSFANGRRAECAVGLALGQFSELRQGEIRYALDQIEFLPWVDANNIVLAGYSEGGGAVRDFPAKQPEVNGVMTFGVGCRGGINASNDVHVFTVLGDQDRYLIGVMSFSTCDAVGHAAPSRAWTVPKGGHDIMSELPVQAGITKMLIAWKR